MKKWIKDRLKEGSTWRGIILVITALGVHLSPELQNLIISTGLSVAGSLGVVTPDKKNSSGVHPNTYLKPKD